MNMQLREQHQRYQAVHARLWGGPKPPAALVIVPQIEAQPVEKPAWQQSDMDFDHHISTWRDVVRKCLEYLACEMAGRPQPIETRKPSKTIVAEVLEHFPGVTVAQLKGERGSQQVCRARQIAIYEVKRQRDDLSLSKIARMFGDRDHSTIHHAIQKIQSIIDAGMPIYPIEEKI